MRSGVNIWTHGLGSLLFLSLLCSTKFLSPHKTVNEADILALAIFFLSVVVCFVLSTLYVFEHRALISFPEY